MSRSPAADGSLPGPLDRWLASAATVAVVTCAGMSAESGIATFRDANQGLWQRFDPLRLATPAAFRDDPALVWGWYRWRMATVRRAHPHRGHQALAALAAQRPGWTLITQNVDDLHERAGSTAVLHLHGELFALRCATCAAPAPAPVADDTAPASLRVLPPRCRQCAGLVRPGVVWFGEALPEATWRAALAAASRCALMLVVGTSGLVEPAASLPGIAAAAGARVVEINPAATALSSQADLCWRTTAATGLPLLARHLGCPGF